MEIKMPRQAQRDLISAESLVAGRTKMPNSVWCAWIWSRTGIPTWYWGQTEGKPPFFCCEPGTEKNELCYHSPTTIAKKDGKWDRVLRGSMGECISWLDDETAKYYALVSAQLLPDHERKYGEHARIADDIRRRFVKLDGNDKVIKAQLPIERQSQIEEQVRARNIAMVMDYEARDAKRKIAETEADPFADELEL